MSVVDSSNIDPSNLNPNQLGLPGVTLDPAVQAFLDALPTISIPATAAQLKVTPGRKIEGGGKLTQHALDLTLTVGGQNVVDLTVGEATVGAAQVNCGGVADLALQCTSRRIVLIDVLRSKGRVKLLGAANRRYAGKRRFSSSASKVSGTSASTAPRTSIVATPGIVCGPGRPLVSGRWSGIGRPAIRSSPRPPAAVAVCADGAPVGGSSLVVADSRLPVIGSGDAGKLPPAEASLHVLGAGWALFAVTGSVRGDGPRVAASTGLAGVALRRGGRWRGGEHGEAEQAEGDGRRGPPPGSEIRHPRLVSRAGRAGRSRAPTAAASRAARGGCRGRTRTSGPGRAGPRRGGSPRP